jgi:hypothetical protein
VTPLDFESVRDAGSASWTRAKDAVARGRTLVEQRAWNEWLVTLPDGSAHEIRLERDHGAYLGSCDCRGFKYREESDRPCAHLCAVRLAAFLDLRDTDGEIVRVLDADEERAQHHAETEAARADGGREVRR